MNDQNLKPLGNGHLTEEEEHAIRSKGGKECAKKKRQARTASELFEVALSSTVTDPQLLDIAKRFGMDGKTVDVALVASVIKNAMRKGTVQDAIDAFSAAGRSENDRDEEAHKAFMRALIGNDSENADDSST